MARTFFTHKYNPNVIVSSYYRIDNAWHFGLGDILKSVHVIQLLGPAKFAGWTFVFFKGMEIAVYFSRALSALSVGSQIRRGVDICPRQTRIVPSHCFFSSPNPVVHSFTPIYP